MVNGMRVVLVGMVAALGLACGPYVDIGDGDVGKANLETTQSMKVDAETHLDLANTFGSITIVGDPSRAEVLVEPTLRSDDPEAGYIELRRDGADIAIAIFQDVADAEVAVDITITTPEDLGFTVATGGGDLSLSGMVAASDCQVATGDGRVDLDLDLNGQDLEVANAQGSGDIALTLPADTEAELNVASAAGSVDVDAALSPDGDGYGGAWSGSLNGGGGSEIDVASASGSISVRAR